MNLSPAEFKKRLLNGLLDLHWKHWTAAGVASHIEPELRWVIDLEALIASTIAIGEHDRRLLSVTLEWIIKNGEWVNLSRFKRIARLFTKPSLRMQEPLLSTKEVNDAIAALRNSEVHRDGIFSGLRRKGTVTEPGIHQPSLLQLLARALLGIDARADVLIYLLLNRSGNSNSIAKDVFYDQKNIYRVLENFTKAAVVTKVSGNKAGNYSLRDDNIWLTILGMDKKPEYINWVKTFLVLDRLAQAISTPSRSEDEYVLSSLFRDLLNDVQPIARPLAITVPDPGPFPGPKYFVPFASAMLKILKTMKEHNE